ncbi:MAG: SDR family oxidoreductase [Candidatus Aenigmarchaeota archaeon]|nr:SDR family oxidoreductase [Candidatus Aenigmarchaeota archaeon]
MENILVTGGGGFIGSHLCDFLLEKGNSVICIDNFGSGSSKNIEHLKGNEKFSLIEHDISENLKLDQKIDKIYHLASRASPIAFKKYPIDIMMTNSLGTFNLLEISRKNNAPILFTSTSEVYGEPEEHPQKETYNGNVNCNGPRSCYDESKRFAEALFFSFNRQYGTEIRIVRLFNTYGPRMRSDDGRVIPNFANQALKNEPITVYGDGSQTRSFCFVTDTVKGLYKMMESGKSGPINLGNPVERTILETAKLVKKLTSSDSEIIFKSLPKDDPTRRKPDITKAKEELDWNPEIDFEEGLEKTIDYFKQF